MEKKFSSADFVKAIRGLAFGKANDVLKLVFLDLEEQELPKHLDLRMVSEIKRSGNGSIEVKLQNRIELIKLLAQYIIAEEPAAFRENGAESFFTAMDKAATQLRAADDEI